MGFNDMSFKVMDGKDYDYDGVEFVYVANQVISKKSVLDQVKFVAKASPGGCSRAHA